MSVGKQATQYTSTDRDMAVPRLALKAKSHLRLAAKLEMQLTISPFCFSAPHMLWTQEWGEVGRTKYMN